MYTDLNRGLLDKMILLAENANMSPVICINKCDLDEVSAKRVCEEYEKAGYPCVYTSTYTQDGLDDLKKLCEVVSSYFPDRLELESPVF